MSETIWSQWRRQASREVLDGPKTVDFSLGTMVLTHVEVAGAIPKLRAVVAEPFVGGPELGFITYEYEGGHPTVDHVEVHDPYKRSGIATAMWRWLEELVPDIQHSSMLLPDGKAWVQSLGSINDEFATIDAIRERHGADQNPRVCAHVAKDIERELGYPSVTGFYRGEKNGRRLWAQHVWNVLPDGSILDATADQWGLDPITVAPRGDQRWDPLSPEQQRWLDRFVREHRKSPTMDDWAFWDAEF